jgi:hypothetical protein
MKQAAVLPPIMAKLTQMVHEKRLPPELPVWLNADLIQSAHPPSHSLFQVALLPMRL